MRSWRSRYERHQSAEVFSIQYSLVITCTCFWGRVWCNKFCLGPWENEAGVPGMSGGYTTQKGNGGKNIIYTTSYVICGEIILKLHKKNISAPLWRIRNNFNSWKKKMLAWRCIFFCERVFTLCCSYHFLNLIIFNGLSSNYICFFYTQFTFAKIWLLYGQFEIRQKNLQNARRGLVSFSL